MVTATTLDRVLGAVVDPEIPVLSIADLGILRDATVTEDGAVTVTITPTYSGCPAMGVIEEDIRTALADAGYDRVTVRTTFSPAWTTDWMTDDARRRLAEYGIAPPERTSAPSAPVVCPQCSAGETRLVSEFGSTACKALMVCSRCGEPFDHFKAI
jgi:ring-1,2-phenylacetyl-CoA epoxidase subunit PaaD